MTIYNIAMTLILVMDPLGNVPVFLAVLKKFDPKTQTRIILRECFIAFLVLTIFLFFGRYILHGLDISTAALSISGGIILFIIAIRMIFPPDRSTSGEDQFEEPLIVPLAIPLTAGPSALATVVLLSTKAPEHLMLLFTALVITCVVFTILMLSSRYLMKLLGKRGLVAIERLMGMILTTISVQMFLTGIVHYIRGG